MRAIANWKKQFSAIWLIQFYSVVDLALHQSAIFGDILDDYIEDDFFFDDECQL